jgi:excisionase family DNA binding protein
MAAVASAPQTTYESVADAARRCHVSTKTIRRRIAEGQLTGYRLAGSHLIRLNPADVDALLRPVPTAGAA